MKRFLALLLLAGAVLFSADSAMAGNNHQNHGNGNGRNHNGHNHNHGYRNNFGRSYGYYRPYNYGIGYGTGYYGGLYGGNYVNYGYPGAVFASPQSFGFGPAAVQSMFGW